MEIELEIIILLQRKICAVAQLIRTFQQLTRNSNIPSKCYCLVVPCNLIDMCVVQGHSSLHCKLLIQVSCLLDNVQWQCIPGVLIWYAQEMLKKIDVEVHSKGDCRRLLLLFLHELPQIASQMEDWGCSQTGFPGAISLLHEVPQIALQMEDWGVFRGGLPDAASLLHELVRSHLITNFQAFEEHFI